MEYLPEQPWRVSLIVLALNLAPCMASAAAHGPRDDGARDASDPPPRSIGGELRGVVLPPTFLGATYLCGDLRIRRSIALVGCGTGSGFLTRPESQMGVRTAELAHFRLDWSAIRRRRTRVFLGAGLAEAELSYDRIGFIFAPTPQAGDVEAAGAEMAGGFDITAPLSSMTLWVRTTLGTAWIPGWATLSGRAPFVPFALLTMNARF